MPFLFYFTGATIVNSQFFLADPKSFAIRLDNKNMRV